MPCSDRLTRIEVNARIVIRTSRDVEDGLVVIAILTGSTLDDLELTCETRTWPIALMKIFDQFIRKARIR